MLNSRTILHVVRNPISFDSRVLKETQSIFSRFPSARILVAGMSDASFPEYELLGNREIYRSRLLTRSLPKNLFFQVIKFYEWQYRLCSMYQDQPIALVHCHDLEPLPIAVKLKRLTGAKLIYDAHELETERNGGFGIRKMLSKFQEKTLMPFVDHLITVSPSIKDWYSQQYPLKPISLVRNIPELVDANAPVKPLRAALGIPGDSLLFLYLGGLGKGRGVEVILKGFSSHGVKHHVLFMGSGPLLEQVRYYAEKCPRIHVQSPVPHAEVIAHARGADVGLCLYEDTCLNHRYCLPNKLFENLLSGIPVLASNLPDQAKIVRDHDAGWVIEPNAAALEEFLQRLKASSARQLGVGLADRVANIRWENEAQTLLKVYQELVT